MQLLSVFKEKGCCLGRYKMPQDYFPSFPTIAYYDHLEKMYLYLCISSGVGHNAVIFIYHSREVGLRLD